MAKTSNDEWELSKENIQPLQQGRKHEVLKVALTLHPDDLILQQRQAFEQELRTYSGNDPLSVWCKYIKWVEQNFPKGGRDGHIEQLLQKCLYILKDEKQYVDDNRFIELWLKFAIATVKPSEVYGYMYSHSIGCKSAHFYVAWAWELEQQGNIKKANEVLTEGLQRKAEPYEKMKSNISEFEMRIASKVCRNSEQSVEPSEKVRSAFSVLKPQKKKNLAPVLRIGEAVCEPSKTSLIIGRQQALPKSNLPSGKVPFKIYNAENIIPSLPVKSENAAPFVLYTDLAKENEKKPCKWNKARAKQTNICPSVAEVKPDFQLHCDEAPQPSFTPRSVPKVSNVLRERQERAKPPMALFEPPDPKRKSMYDRNKVYGGAEELSLEEIKAASWYKNQKECENEKQLSTKEKLVFEQQEYIKSLQQQVELLKKEKISVASKASPLLEAKDKEKPRKVNMNTLDNNSSLLKLSDNIKDISSKKQLPAIDKQPVVLETFGTEKLGTKFSYTNSLPPNLPDNVEGNCTFDKSVLQKDLLTDAKLTTTYNEAARMVCDLYNGTFFNPIENIQNNEYLQKEDGNKFQPKSIMCNEKQFLPSFDLTQDRELGNAFVHKKQLEQHPLATCDQNEPFTFYRDPTEKIPKSNLYTMENLPSSQQHVTDCCLTNQENIPSQDEDRENVPPTGYINEKINRELSGILEPSKDILYLPLELQEKLDEKDEDLDLEEECIYENNLVQDETMKLPCNTEQFVVPHLLLPHLASTPRTQVKKAKVYPSITTEEDQGSCALKSNEMSSDNHNAMPVVAIPKEISDNKQMCKADPKIGMKDHSILATLPGQLSMIMESSREGCKTSSSSGSSGSATQLSQFYSQDKSNICKQISKVETFKEPLPPGQNIDSINVIRREIAEPKNLSEKETFEIHCTDIDPFSEELKENFLKSVNLSPDFTRKITISNEFISDLKEGDVIEIGGVPYLIKNLISNLSYAKIYVTMNSNGRMDTSNTEMALKVCKNPNSWEFYICSMLHQRLEEINTSPDVAMSVLKITSARRYSNGIVYAFEFSQLGTLVDLVTLYKKQTTAVPELIAMYLTSKLLKILSKIHECKIVHSDVKPDNIFICDEVLNTDALDYFSEKTSILKFVEFNQAIDLKCFKNGICFQTAMNGNYMEVMEQKPWVFQPDWYGLLNCVHFLLFSEHMKVKKTASGKWSIEKRFKRFWDQTIWVPLFDELLNMPSCYQEPDVEKHTSKIESKLKQNMKNFQLHMAQLANLYPGYKQCHA